MIEELGRHGYKLGLGTLYPLLRRLEEQGFLRSHQESVGGNIRRVYRADSQPPQPKLERPDRIVEERVAK
jgi:PadR family transcriptional regulator, regulatory protein PadR